MRVQKSTPKTCIKYLKNTGKYGGPWESLRRRSWQFEYKKYDENGEVEETIRAVDGVDLDVKKGRFCGNSGA